ncbi:MAG: DNA adenine methylase [Desulfuromonadales bacterium]|nr:DNA adenine methylase [Desulfuromonadales bacterium]
MSFLTPLRYPGGKGRLGPWLAGLLKHNQIDGGWYIEPYAGGAGAALYLLSKGCVDHIVINDADPVVHAFWLAVVNDNEQLVKMISDTSVTIDEWYRQHEILSKHSDYEAIEVAFATFFLNRTNRSGILSAGVIGGKSQEGSCKLDARFNKADLCERIRNIGKMRQHISVYGLDAMELLNLVSYEAPAKSLTYFDPPYYEKGSQLYRNFYKPEDHAEIAAMVCDLQKPWVVTYDNCEPIKKLYSTAQSMDFSLFYSTHQARTRTTEALFYGNLNLHESPYMTRRS